MEVADEFINKHLDWPWGLLRTEIGTDVRHLLILLCATACHGRNKFARDPLDIYCI